MTFPVSLNVYDLSGGMAKQMSMAFIGKQIDGIWHTGIVVYNKEFFYGGGICYDLPAKTPFGTPTKTIELGSTEIPEDMFMEMLKDLMPRFTMEAYNLLQHNCNNFTDECAQLLLGEGIPKDIVDLPKLFLETPMGQSFAPMIMSMQDGMKVQSNSLFN